MNRSAALGRIHDQAELWDLVVVGGGATGVGIAVDEAWKAGEARDFVALADGCRVTPD